MGVRVEARYGARMLVDDIKARITKAMKEKDEVARDVLRVAYGEIQKLEANAAKDLKDDEVAAVLRKLVKSNEETLVLAPDGAQAPALKREIEVLTSLLPKTLSVAEIAAALAPVKEAVVAAKSDGQATGVAMKHLKSTGATCDGNDVAAAVKLLRA